MSNYYHLTPKTWPGVEAIDQAVTQLITERFSPFTVDFDPGRPLWNVKHTGVATIGLQFWVSSYPFKVDGQISRPCVAFPVLNNYAICRWIGYEITHHLGTTFPSRLFYDGAADPNGSGYLEVPIDYKPAPYLTASKSATVYAAELELYRTWFPELLHLAAPETLETRG